MDPVIILGLSASAIVVLLVQVFKALKMPDSWAPWATFIASLVAVGIGLVIKVFPAAQEWIVAAFTALTVFLASTGLYHVGKNVGTSTGLVQEKPKVDTGITGPLT